jgi:uncharacterized protein
MSDFLKRFGRVTGWDTPEAEDCGRGVNPDCGRGVNPDSKVETEYGPVTRIRKAHTEAWPYGLSPMGDILTPDVTKRCGFLKDKLLAGFSREQALFLDVEATGLSHGAGTVAFLLGLGYYDGDTFIVEQLLMEDYDQEQAQLQLFLEHLERTEYLVSYNGKSYDRSVLENRLVVNRFMDRNEAHLKLRPHLDLLHTGRRVLKGTLENHKLGNMEKQVLDFDRGEDLPGELVPQMYFQYLLTNDWAYMEPVLKHNYYDVLSMAHLAHRLLDLVHPERLPDDPLVSLNLGRLFLQTERWEAAAFHLRYAASNLLGDDAVRAASGLARALLKQSAAWDEIVAVWEDGARLAPDSTKPHIELAKIHEWKLKDREAALHHAHRACELGADELSRVTRLEARFLLEGRKP